MTRLIRTRRLTLAPVASTDVDAISELLWQPEVRHYLCDNVLLPRADIEASVLESLDPASVAAHWRIAIDGHDCAGLVGLRPLSPAMLGLRAIGWRSLEMLIALRPMHWGRGYASEAIEAVAGYAGADGVTFALVAAVDEPNEGSHRLMRRCAFAELGRVAGPKHPLVVYERTV